MAEGLTELCRWALAVWLLEQTSLLRGTLHATAAMVVLCIIFFGGGYHRQYCGAVCTSQAYSVNPTR